MRRSLWGYILWLLLLTGCTDTATAPEPAPSLQAIALDTVKVVAGQTIYVPIYSHIYTWERNRAMNLTATLSVRNTDQNHPLILSSVNYYNSNGQLVRKYLEQPVELGPMASTNFLVDQDDTSGGAGASFLVEWVAQAEINDPVVEAVMINAATNQGLSFVSIGRVIKSVK